MASAAPTSPSTGVSSSHARSRRLLLSILTTPKQADAFVEFCHKEHSQENVLFWSAVRAYKQITAPSRLLAEAEAIMHKFLLPGSELEVNLSLTQRERLRARVEAGDVDAGVFDKLENVAERQMAADSLPRFLKSDLWEAVKGTLAVAPARTKSRSASAKPRLRSERAASSSAVLRLSPPRAKQSSPPVTRSASTRSVMRSAPSPVTPVSRKARFLGLSFRKRPSADEREVLEQMGVSLRANALKSGFMLKRGNRNKTWHRRWFILTADMLGYFTDEFSPAPIAVIPMEHVSGVEPDLSGVLGKVLTFGVVTAHRMYVFQAASRRDRQRWVKALSDGLVTEDVSRVGLGLGSPASSPASSLRSGR